ncbi:hypothetical protein PYCCODRAFT_1472880 [Trametes coccinea BRFM310]|uniref:Uncharacterized protein n=1 Tax=Trametes coccinea (strain BRFM310) TaxID=1353009 RepID=A0A1Y2I4G1_TRAC3|nr:hypothetical protein PYCCODRAFT_1472880 [Trametes coccinea BRFM310]
MLPDVDEVTAFDPANGPCGSGTDFRPDLSAKPSSVWNKCIIQVFVEIFMARYPSASEVRVEELFTGHIGYLCHKWQLALKDEPTKRKIKKLANRAERQRNLYHRRLTVAHAYAPLRQHISMIEDLGVHGMSSDESDHRNGVAQYGVFQKEWRNPAITKWLRVFDSLYRRLRLNEVNHSTPGSHPHLRFLSDKTDSRHPPRKGLPQNAYAPEWLKKLNAYDTKLLQVREESYDFVHDAELEKQVLSS